MNVRFGLYFIPEDGKFYQTGSSVVGYDIRRQALVSLPDFVQPAWIASNTQFGFHASITDAITVDEQKLPEIMDRALEVLRCLNPGNRYVLSKERVGFWRDSSNQAALMMTPNRNVELLHDVLVTALHPLGTGTEYTQDATKTTPATATDARKLESFYSPYIFDQFKPHFTCIASYDGPAEGRAEIESKLEQLFDDISEVEFNSIAFVVQGQDDKYFRIQREFSLHGE